MSEAEHRVQTHLGVSAETYDVAIRRFIPGYEAMVNSIIAILDDSLGPTPTIVDLGTGTGALGGAILDAIPRAKIVMIDIDPTMLGVAGARVAKHGSRAELRKASFFDPLPDADAIVASLALHHVPELAKKRELYSQIYRALKPGGVFLLGDATCHETGPEHERIYREWEAGMATAGIPHEEATELFTQWALEDRYYPLGVELQALAAAGFKQPDCFWKQGAITVYGGFT